MTATAGWLAEGAWVYEIRGVWWTSCIRELTAYVPDERGWMPQDAVTLAEIEGTDGPGQITPQDIMAITATIPAARPDDPANEDDRVLGHQLWMDAAKQAGEGTTWTVARFGFGTSTVPVEAHWDDPSVCAAVLVNHRWYVIKREGDTVRASLVPID
jgi:hypothetical protein